MLLRELSAGDLEEHMARQHGGDPWLQMEEKPGLQLLLSRAIPQVTAGESEKRKEYKIKRNILD